MFTCILQWDCAHVSALFWDVPCPGQNFGGVSYRSAGPWLLCITLLMLVWESNVLNNVISNFFKSSQTDIKGGVSLLSQHIALFRKKLLSNNDHYNLHVVSLIFQIIFAKQTSCDFFSFFSPSVLLRVSLTTSTVLRVFSTVRFIPDLSTQGYCKVARTEIFLASLLPFLPSFSS